MHTSMNAEVFLQCLPPIIAQDIVARFMQVQYILKE